MKNVLFIHQYGSNYLDRASESRGLNNLAFIDVPLGKEHSASRIQIPDPVTLVICSGLKGHYPRVRENLIPGQRFVLYSNDLNIEPAPGIVTFPKEYGAEHDLFGDLAKIIKLHDPAWGTFLFVEDEDCLADALERIASKRGLNLDVHRYSGVGQFEIPEKTRAVVSDSLCGSWKYVHERALGKGLPFTLYSAHSDEIEKAKKQGIRTVPKCCQGLEQEVTGLMLENDL